MTAGIQHIDVGAYALGLLEEPDRRAFEAHLSTCLSCHEELGVLRNVAATLDGIAPIEDPLRTFPVEPDPAVVSDLIQRRVRRDRRRAASRTLVSVAAGVVLLAGAFGLGTTIASDGGTPSPTPTVAAPPPDAGADALLSGAQAKSATNSVTGVAATVATQGKLWGSSIAFKLDRVRGPLECNLVAIDRDGRAHQIAGWKVPPKGYGQPGSGPPLTVQGATSLTPAQISRYEVRTAGDDHTLLTIPA
ncbi:zf-HC2 domain-containing protein [Spirillospora sp. NPDC047279]|uniref:zf-HC2 domain-containing protein n=1 Tax=Spirillospora sp. NPDC047279 TaxID=3155478 RepID=UPI0033DD3A3F